MNVIKFTHTHTHTHTHKYVGKSQIIRTIGTCFAVGYTAGWA